ncbi:MAG: MAPEG family protein [Panacagrimonas sp.]
MTGIEALLYYVLLMIALVLIYAGQRIPLALLGKKPIQNWTRGQANDDPGFVVRAKHAHENTVENLPLFAAVVLAGAVMDQSALINSLACYVLYARLAQVFMHLLGTSFILIMLRATFFLVQIGIIAYLAWMLVCPPAAA